MPVIGPIVNAAAIAIGATLGLARVTPISPSRQSLLKAMLGAATVIVGLRLTLASFSPSIAAISKLIAITLLAMTLGKLTGKLLRLQKASNYAGKIARAKMANPGAREDRFANGFAVCAILFCAAPLGIMGALTDGLAGHFWPLIIKGVMDGVAAMSFAAMFGAGVLFSAIPVLVLQGTISVLATRFLVPVMERYDLIDPFNATAGLLIFTIALVIFEVKKIEVSDYLPSLAIAPLLAWWWN